MGIDDSEFGIAGSDARIHLYAGGGFTQPPNPLKAASSKFGAGLNGGASFGSAETFWSSATNLKKYDVVLLSCEHGHVWVLNATQHSADTVKAALERALPADRAEAMLRIL